MQKTVGKVVSLVYNGVQYVLKRWLNGRCYGCGDGGRRAGRYGRRKDRVEIGGARQVFSAGWQAQEITRAKIAMVNNKNIPFSVECVGLNFDNEFFIIEFFYPEGDQEMKAAAEKSIATLNIK